MGAVGAPNEGRDRRETRTTAGTDFESRFDSATDAGTGAGARGLGPEHSGDDLSIVFPGAGTIRLEGFAALAESAAPPRLILPDGSELGVDELLASLDGGPEETPPIETAAGAETGAGEAGEAGDTASSGGGRAYGDLGGPSVAGLAALGTLDVASDSGVPNFPLAEDLAEPASAAVTVTV